MIDTTRLNIEEEIYNTIKMVPSSIVVISKLYKLINLILLIPKQRALAKRQVKRLERSDKISSKRTFISLSSSFVLNWYLEIKNKVRALE